MVLCEPNEIQQSHVQELRSSEYLYKLGEVLESSPSEKDSGVLVDEKLIASQWSTPAVQKASGIWDPIRRRVASKSRKVIVPVCSALVRPRLEYCIQVWCPQHKKGVELSERLQRRARKMM